MPPIFRRRVPCRIDISWGLLRSFLPQYRPAVGATVKIATVVFWVAAMALGLVAGCATNAGGFRSEAEVVERLKQLTMLEVSLKLGAPTERVDLGNDRETWTYDSVLVSIIGGQCKISITFEGDSAIDALVNSFDYSPLAAPMGSCSQLIRKLD